MKKIKVLHEINIDTSMFMTSFEKAAKLLIIKKEELEKQGWSSISLEMEYYYDNSELVAKGLRLETDVEFNIRKSAEEKKLLALEKKTERERLKYEKLKIKFG